jgi:hypothetical protein
MNTFNIKKLKYDIDQVIGHFGLHIDRNSAILKNWVDVSVESSFVIPDALEGRRQKLAIEGVMWNEEELKMHFLSIVFLYCNIEVLDKIKLFYERSLSGVVQNTPLTVICDALLAAPMGYNTPKTPYFFLQEFKKGKKAQDDAEGQMLIAMLIAQTLNNNDKPIYGCYLLGKDWYFTTLYQQNYSYSKSYDATQVDELIQILHILSNLKNVIASH